MKNIPMQFLKSPITMSVAGLAFILVTWMFIVSSPKMSVQPLYEEKKEINPDLLMAAEELNNVLPQRQGMNTFLDSIGVSFNNLNYYYSLSDINQHQFINKGLEDSLYNEASNRIPCTLWRPLYMQGVEVTFTYFSNDNKQLLQFSRIQDECH